TIFVLQTFAVQRSTTGSPADQEAASLLVASLPAQVADTLEPESDRGFPPVNDPELEPLQ
ncbi:hypothetical protein MJM59_27810, partial [Salmonella enterica subsp. enterica serovar Montevideo]|nr:hypothetical protein [Salmonella enterica subsp. enterica serovar Montevideo]